MSDGETRPPRRRGLRPSPGGVGDGLPAMPDGEPLLARWFAVAMILLVLAGIGLSVVAFTTRVVPPDEALPPASRRPLGTDVVTHDRGQIVVADTDDVETGVGCAPNVRLVGDVSGRGAARNALLELCAQLERHPAALDDAALGLIALDDQGGIIRVALSAATGVDSSARVEDSVVVIELAPKFQFSEPSAAVAAPFLAHELAHMARGRWPGTAVDAAAELRALEVQRASCDALDVAAEQVPRGCLDAAGVLDDPDPLRALVEAGYAA